MKEFAPLGSKFFSFRVDPLSLSEKGSSLKGKNLIPLGAKSFHLE